MLLRSFEPPNLPFPASMISICIVSILFTSCFKTSNHPIFHSWPVCYLYVLSVFYLQAASKLLRSFEPPNLPFLASRLCYLHAASELRTTQSSIPGQYAIYMHCQYAIYMLLRSFEPSNLPFPASVLSIRIASMPFTCCFGVLNHPFR